jgi:5-methylcytosine-specific restriction endonuclease McrA
MLPPRRTRWCSEDCSRAFSRNHFWTNARAARLDYDDHRCVVCGDPEDLQVHHRRPVDRPGGYGAGCQHHQENLETLCLFHHGERHRTGEVQLSLLAV